MFHESPSPIRPAVEISNLSENFSSIYQILLRQRLRKPSIQKTIDQAIFEMWVSLVVGCCLTYMLASFITHRYFYRRQRSNGWKLLRDVRRILIVVAHPDDECLFFGPLLQGLLKGSPTTVNDDDSEASDANHDAEGRVFNDPDVHILCLSSGDFRKQGHERKSEFLRSCKRLGIIDSHITVIEHTKLPDDPAFIWNKQLVKEIVLRHVEQLAVDTVVSFDRYGVSGHTNHAAIYIALQQLYSRGKLPVDTRVFVLESVNLLRKYVGLLDIPWSCWRSNYCYVNDWGEYSVCVSAMKEHRSQLTWFRILYLFFSRYMIVNTLKRISPVPK